MFSNFCMYWKWVVGCTAISMVWIACNNAANSSPHFALEGVAFDVPSGWAIVDNDTIGNSGRYISCEKKGFGETIFVVFTWLNTPFDTQQSIQMQREAILANPMFLKWRTRLSDTDTADFAGNTALRFTYTSRVGDDDLQGDVYCFNCGGKALTVLFQGTAQDLTTDAAAWQYIRQSFTCALP